jgi:phospholipid/cholesterol/gamma-HCH transport system permease protein
MGKRASAMALRLGLRPGGPVAVVRLEGDLVIGTTPRLYRELRGLARRRGVHSVVLDFAGAGRLDSSGVAVVSIGSRMMAEAGKAFDLRNLDEQHEAAFALLPAWPDGVELPERRGVIELVGERVLAGMENLAGFIGLVIDTGREAIAVAARQRRLPAGALIDQANKMGVDALLIVCLLSFLLGTTLAFQGAVQLQQFGADIFVADLVGLAVVREFGPMMTAIILTGRTGAAIAAELGTMRVREEVDALRAMGVSPIRFLVVPRVAALTLVQPALTLLAIFVGIAGGMLIAATAMDLSPVAFWDRMVQRLTFSDFLHGLGKSLVFAWIIAFVGAFMGLRTRGGASSVGTAATRAVVIGIFLIIVVDSVFATITTLARGP